MPTTNERLFDAQVRHQIDLRRWARGEARRLLGMMAEYDLQVADQLRRDLQGVATGRGGPLTKRQKAQVQELLGKAKATIHKKMKAARQRLRKNLIQLARNEAHGEMALLKRMMPIEEVELHFPEQLDAREVVAARIMNGLLLREWWQRMAQHDVNNLTRAIKEGLANGEGADQIVKRVAGTKRRNFSDGTLAITRRHAEGLVDTSATHVSQETRREVWQRNSHVIRALRWTATLDGRTTAVCRARDGAMVPLGDNGSLPEGARKLVPEGARPPAHYNCRSVMVPVLHGPAIVGERPQVTDVRNRRQREIDFRADAKERIGKDRWGRMSERERRGAIRWQRRKWTRENVGTVPRGTTYEEFLKRQPKGFQEEVLGVRKAQLFRKGELPLNKFVDRGGNELSLEQLRSRYPDAWEEAGLDNGS